MKVVPFHAPRARGAWPCGFCDELFPVRDSWHVQVRHRGRVIACPACARDAAEHLSPPDVDLTG
ncbi:MAG TPA: hypothetical protein VHF25_00375 [Nitriliruptorales bacterium]|nr:hypothetical protein [Nitriliruptorales bacterium]